MWEDGLFLQDSSSYAAQKNMRMRNMRNNGCVFLAVSYGDTADTVHIILISLTPVIKIALEVEPCSISVRVYYDPYKIYFNIFVRF